MVNDVSGVPMRNQAYVRRTIAQGMPEKKYLMPFISKETNFGNSDSSFLFLSLDKSIFNIEFILTVTVQYSAFVATFMPNMRAQKGYHNNMLVILNIITIIHHMNSRMLFCWKDPS